MKESKVAFLKNLESGQVKYPAYITVQKPPKAPKQELNRKK